jgi:hypothetical protein
MMWRWRCWDGGLSEHLRWRLATEGTSSSASQGPAEVRSAIAVLAEPRLGEGTMSVPPAQDRLG